MWFISQMTEGQRCIALVHMEGGNSPVEGVGQGHSTHSFVH